MQKYGQQNLLKNKGEYYALSVYSGELTPKGCAEAVKKIKDAFPDLPDGFHDILSDRVLELGFSDERFLDAVKHVIDTCEYPTPTVAKFVSYDRAIKLYSYDQYLKLEAKKQYKPTRVKNGSAPMWAHVNDIERYKLERFDPKA